MESTRRTKVITTNRKKVPKKVCLLSTDPMVQWLRLPTADPEVLGSNPG
jgi:hypothetical protein